MLAPKAFSNEDKTCSLPKQLFPVAFHFELAVYGFSVQHSTYLNLRLLELKDSHALLILI